jgi:hypothetical protein
MARLHIPGLNPNLVNLQASVLNQALLVCSAMASKQHFGEDPHWSFLPRSVATSSTAQLQQAAVNWWVYNCVGL